MKEEQDPQSISTKSTLSSSSMISSMRNLIACDNDGIEEEDDDDDSFVFTDRTHQHQQFELLSSALIDFGLIDSSIQNHEAEKPESIPLLKKRDNKVEAKGVKLKAKETQKEPRAIHPYRRESKINAYNKGKKEVFLEVLDQIDMIQSTTRKEKGFKEWKFAFGLVNCLLVAYVFGSHPEHFWILYAMETSFWMIYKFRGMYSAKPLSEVLYYLDFCWVMNALNVMIFVVMIVLDTQLSTDIMPIEVREKVFMACFGVFCGPIFVAAMVLPFVAFLFHDVNSKL